MPVLGLCSILKRIFLLVLRAVERLKPNTELPDLGSVKPSFWTLRCHWECVPQAQGKETLLLLR